MRGAAGDGRPYRDWLEYRKEMEIDGEAAVREGMAYYQTRRNLYGYWEYF